MLDCNLDEASSSGGGGGGVDPENSERDDQDTCQVYSSCY